MWFETNDKQFGLLQSRMKNKAAPAPMCMIACNEIKRSQDDIPGHAAAHYTYICIINFTGHDKCLYSQVEFLSIFSELYPCQSI
jgi:hypothetical protein